MFKQVVQCAAFKCNVFCVTCYRVCFISGMHHEGTGREIQAAGSSGGSDAEGPEIPPAAQGITHPTQRPPTAEGRHI